MQLDDQPKKITFKFLNQLKLMIKPPQRIVQITGALVTLLGGTISSIQGHPIKTDWPSIKNYLRNTNEIIEIINDQATFLKRVRFENLEKSISISQLIQQSEDQDENFDKLQETLNQLLLIAKPLFKNLLLCSKSRKRDRSLSNQSLHYKKTHPTQQSQKSIDNKLNSSQVSKSQRPKSQQSNLSDSRSLSGTKEYQKRVQLAQNKKQSRLDKILKLQTHKPNHIKSQVKQIIDGQPYNNSYRSKSKESLLKQEIEKNKSIIKKLKVQENAIKWQIERESKQIQENNVVNSIKDEINRYKISWEQDQKIKDTQRKNSLRKQSQSKSTNYNYAYRNGSLKQDENKIGTLEQEYRLSQKQKNDYENSFNKILKNLNNSKIKINDAKN